MKAEPPLELDGARVEQYTLIDDLHEATGAGAHAKNGIDVSTAAGLAICRYQGEDQVYLFHCDASWSVMIDTVHESVEEARDQAEFEHRGSSETWVAR